MSEQPSAELKRLRSDNARLRHLLAREGAGAELRHQVRNTLAQIRAIIRRSSEINGEAVDFAAHLEGRLDAILRAQNAMVSSLAEGVDLHSLVSNELLAYLAQEGKQSHIQGPDLYLRPRAAEVLGLAFHELATNSLKFGALGDPAGSVAVEWQVTRGRDATPSLGITWKESDGPPIGGTPKVRGFGTEVLERMLDYQLGARSTLAFEPSGLLCAIVVPLTPDVGSLASTSSSEDDG